MSNTTMLRPFRTRIVIFAKAPLPGLAKTRLIPALGEQGASRLAAKLLKHCVNQAVGANIGPVELCVSPDKRHPIWNELALPASLEWAEQGEGDLGERMFRATRRTIDNGEAVLLIGTDCPELTSETLREAAQTLEHQDTCMVPVSDGGYVLLGLTCHRSSVFSNIPWSTASVARLTQQRIQEEGWTFTRLASLHDIDEPADLQHLPVHWQEVFQ